MLLLQDRTVTHKIKQEGLHYNAFSQPKRRNHWTCVPENLKIIEKSPPTQ